MKILFNQTTLQVLLIVLGICGGIYFSILTSIAHNTNHEHVETTLCSKHGYKEINNDSIIPQITNLKINKDAMSGWNLYFETKNFHLKPENLNAKHLPGQGHAHLLMNGQKVARIYSNWYHISNSDKTIQEVELILTTNSHETMTLNGQPIAKKLYSVK